MMLYRQIPFFESTRTAWTEKKIKQAEYFISLYVKKWKNF